MTTTATPTSTTATPNTVTGADLTAALATANDTLRAARQHLLHAKAQPDALAAAYQQAILDGDADAMRALRQQYADAVDTIYVRQARFHQAEMALARLQIADLEARIAAEEAERAVAHTALGNAIAIGPRSAELAASITQARRTLDDCTHVSYGLRQERTAATTRLDAARRALDMLPLTASSCFEVPRL